MKFDRLERARKLVEHNGVCHTLLNAGECDSCPFKKNNKTCITDFAYYRAKEYIEKREVIDYVLQGEEK